MIILVGKSASGKNRIVTELENFGFSRIVTYTTRPPRKKEKDGVDYHFITEEEFKDKVKDDYFAEYTSYSTTSGTWWYGSAKQDYINCDEKTIVILAPLAAKKIKEIMDTKPYIFYIFSNPQTIKNRLNRRCDQEECKRRMLSDNVDFKGFEMECDKIIYNNDCDKICDVVQKILRYANM